jgi:ABC-type proline/glycine betaine transport system ATPase subunit
VIALGGLAMASAIFVILDMDTPFGGLFSISRQPMRDALAQLSR